MIVHYLLETETETETILASQKKVISLVEYEWDTI